MSITERIRQRQKEALASLTEQGKLVTTTRFDPTSSSAFEPNKDFSSDDDDDDSMSIDGPAAATSTGEPEKDVPDDAAEEESSVSSPSSHSAPPKRTLNRALLRTLIEDECDSGSASEDEDGNRIKKDKKRKRSRKRKREESDDGEEDEEDTEDRAMIDDASYDDHHAPPARLAFLDRDELAEQEALRKASLIVSGAATSALHKKALVLGHEQHKSRRLVSKTGEVRPLGQLLDSESIIGSSDDDSGESDEDSDEKREREAEEREIFGDSASEEADEDEDDADEEESKDEAPKAEKAKAGPLGRLSAASTINRSDVIEQATEAIQRALGDKKLTTSEPTKQHIRRFLASLFAVATSSLAESGKNKGTREAIVSVDKSLPFNHRIERVRRCSVDAIKDTEGAGITPALFRRLLGSHLPASFAMSIVDNLTAKHNCQCALTGVAIPENSPIELLLVRLPQKESVLSFVLAAHAPIGRLGKAQLDSVRSDEPAPAPVAPDAMDVDEAASSEEEEEEEEVAQENQPRLLRADATLGGKRATYVAVAEPSLLNWFHTTVSSNSKRIFSSLPTEAGRNGESPVYFAPDGLPNRAKYDWARIAEYYIVRKLFTLQHLEDATGTEKYFLVDNSDVLWPTVNRFTLLPNLNLNTAYIRRILEMTKEPPVENTDARDCARNAGKNLEIIAQNGIRSDTAKALHLVPSRKKNGLITDTGKLRFYPRFIGALLNIYQS